MSIFDEVNTDRAPDGDGEQARKINLYGLSQKLPIVGQSAGDRRTRVPRVLPLLAGPPRAAGDLPCQLSPVPRPHHDGGGDEGIHGKGARAGGEAAKRKCLLCSY